jgi:hypothetical protein
MTAVLPLLLASACGFFDPSLGQLNLRPEKYYQDTVKVKARVARIQRLDGETLLELEDQRHHRLLARVNGPFEVGVDDWVKAKGVFVHDIRVGDTILYDVLAVEDISTTGSPWLPVFD